MTEKTLHQLQLKKAHTDAGKTYEAGETIEVDEPTAKWLVENGVADAPKDGAAPARSRTAAAG